MSLKVNKSISDNQIVCIECKKSLIAPQFSPIETLKILDAKENGKFLVSDTFLLLNQERLQSFLGQEGYLNYIASLRPRLKTDNINMTDDDILSTTKSRYCQSPSEILAWTSELASRFSVVKEVFDQKVALYKEKIEKEKAAAAAAAQNSVSSDSQ